jgi:hypothetical protein
MPATAVAADIQVVVAPTKERYVLAEPVYLRVTVSNTGDRAAEVSANPMWYGMRVHILGPNGREIVVASSGGGIDLLEYKNVTLEVGQHVEDRVVVSHDDLGRTRGHNFPFPGEYAVWAEYAWEGLEARSERVTVSVVEPQGVDAEAVDWFFSQAAQRFIVSGGYGALDRSGMVDFLEKFPESTYAPYAAYYVAVRKMHPGRYTPAGADQRIEVPADPAKALELFRFAEARPDFPLKKEAKLREAQCLKDLGKVDEAKAILKTLGPLPSLRDRSRAEQLNEELDKPAAE